MDAYNNHSFHSEPSPSYSSCRLEGASRNSVPCCFMTASSPVPFSEISAEFSIPQLIPEVECTSVLRSKSKPKAGSNTGKFKCKRCSKRFKTKGGLNLHLREHQPDAFLIKVIIIKK